MWKFKNDDHANSVWIVSYHTFPDRFFWDFQCLNVHFDWSTLRDGVPGRGSDLDRNRIYVRKETRLTSTHFSAFCFRLFSVHLIWPIQISSRNYHLLIQKRNLEQSNYPNPTIWQNFWLRFDYNVKTTRFHVAFLWSDWLSLIQSDWNEANWAPWSGTINMFYLITFSWKRIKLRTWLSLFKISKSQIFQKYHILEHFRLSQFISGSLESYALLNLNYNRFIERNDHRSFYGSSRLEPLSMVYI